jgi:putative transposase
MVDRIRPMGFTKGHKHTMALEKSALLEVPGALKAAEVDEKIRLAAETIYQALIEAELSAVIGAAQYQWTMPGPVGQRAGGTDDHHDRGNLELKISKRSG